VEGWLKLYRCLIEKPIWKLSTPAQKTILITLLCMVNHDAEEWEWKGKKYICKPGQKITSLDKIRKECGKGVSIQNIRTAFVRFEKLEFLTYESTKESRLVTILNWELYQSCENNQQSNQQTGNKGVTTNKNDKNDKNIKDINNIFVADSLEIKLVEKLKQLILTNNANAKVPDNLQGWAKEFDLMMRIDKRTEEQLNTVIEFSQKDAFWKTNILSPAKLRKQFDTLWLQKDRENKPPGQSTKPPQSGNFEQRQYPPGYYDQFIKNQ